MKGECLFGHQEGPCGLYARIILEASISDDYGLHISYAHKEEETWKPHVMVGARLFMESQSTRDGRDGLNVHILFLGTMPCDTYSMAVSYAVFRALHQALGTGDPNYFTYDQSSGMFLIRGLASQGA